MGSSSVPTPRAPLTAAQQLSCWLNAYQREQDDMFDVARKDEANRLSLTKEFTPQYNEISLESSGQVTQGMIDLYKRFAPQQLKVAEDMGNLTADAALRLSDKFGAASEGKEANAVRKLLGEQVLGELQSGSSLDPEMRREVEQAVRQGQVSRGMTHGNAAVFEEAMTKGSAGQSLRTSRQNAAMQFLQGNAATRPDVMAWLTGGNMLAEGKTYNPTYASNSELMMPMITAQMGQDEEYNKLKYNVDQQNRANRAQMISSAVNMFAPYTGAGNAVAAARA